MKKRGKERGRYWNKTFYALLIGFAVISFWRGIWGLWDIYVYPDFYALSLWFSVFTGLVILYLTRNVVKQFIIKS